MLIQKVCLPKCAVVLLSTMHLRACWPIVLRRLIRYCFCIGTGDAFHFARHTPHNGIAVAVVGHGAHLSSSLGPLSLFLTCFLRL